MAHIIPVIATINERSMINKDRHDNDNNDDDDDKSK